MATSLARMRQLESVYGAIGYADDPVLNGVKASYIAAVTREGNFDTSNETVRFSTTNMKSADELINMTRDAQQRNHFMPSGNTRQELLGYTATHEYGHMVQNMLNKRGGTSIQAYAVRVRNEISDIARRNYGADADAIISRYGSTNAREFFAECFANANSSAPNALGLATREWLRGEGFAI